VANATRGPNDKLCPRYSDPRWRANVVVGEHGARVASWRKHGSGAGIELAPLIVDLAVRGRAGSTLTPVTNSSNAG